MNFKKASLAVCLILAAASLPLAYAADQVDNPKYTVWSHFKEGSSSTLSTDATVMGQQAHIDIVNTLITLTPDSAVVETATTMSVMGQKSNQPVKRQTITAKIDQDNYVAKEDQDVQAMGKSFKCKVFELQPAGTTSMPTATSRASSKPTTLYVNNDVPGGLVKLEMEGPLGPLTLTLSAMVSK